MIQAARLELRLAISLSAWISSKRSRCGAALPVRMRRNVALIAEIENIGKLSWIRNKSPLAGLTST